MAAKHSTDLDSLVLNILAERLTLDVLHGSAFRWQEWPLPKGASSEADQLTGPEKALLAGCFHALALMALNEISLLSDKPAREILDFFNSEASGDAQ